MDFPKFLQFFFRQVWGLSKFSQDRDQVFDMNFGGPKKMSFWAGNVHGIMQTAVIINNNTDFNGIESANEESSNGTRT